MSAEAEVSPWARQFRFVTNCSDERVESERFSIVLGFQPSTERKYDATLAQCGSLAKGTGRFWITDSRITHEEDTPGDKLGKIEWMKFSVEILLPRSLP